MIHRRGLITGPVSLVAAQAIEFLIDVDLAVVELRAQYCAKEAA